MANRLKMRILLLLSLVYINCDYLQAQTTIPRFEEGERVVFVGNSITHGGHYHSFIWLYYMTRFPDKPITRKPADVRMGKGKGAPEGFVAPVTPGRIIIEAEGVSYEIAKEALRLAAQKLPITTKFVVRRDYDIQNQNA